MPASMYILGWKSKGFRCPDHSVEFLDTSERPYAVTLIQMPNGTGKTTTLELLRAALSGSAGNRDLWPPVRVRSFKKKEGSELRGYFELRLSLNGRLTTIILDFDFATGRVHYRTTHGDGLAERFAPPFDFRKFLSENFVSFYVFDGELAQQLLSREHTDAEMVVEHLFQINTLQVMSEKVSEYWDKNTANTTATEERGFSRRKNRVLSLRERYQLVKTEAAARENLRQTIIEQLERQKETHEQEIKSENDRATQLTNAQLRVEQSRALVAQQSLDALDIMTKPYALSTQFAQDIYELKQGLDRVKLPESAAREFFEELSEEDICVCGRPITDEIRNTIRSRAEQYLGSDDVSLLNSMKTAIEEAVGRSRTKAEQELRDVLNTLGKSARQLKRAHNELDDLKISAADSDPAVRNAAEEIARLERELSQVEVELEKYSSDDEHRKDNSFGVDVIRKRLEEAEHDLSEITQTIDLKQKREILQRILKKAHQKARVGVAQEIIAEANERIGELMPYNNIRIDRIERSLVLEGQEGGSAGEQLSVAYAFLSTLFNRSEHQLPFVVDSPAGPIDLDIRPEIGRLVPKLSGQFIAFTISSEREGFVPSVKSASGDSIQFLTLFRRGAPHLEAKARTMGQYQETDDGISVLGEEFFNAFQDEEFRSELQALAE